MISVEGLKVEFNATPLFEDVSYVINKKDRIALVGKNGAGKSTMLKILAGIQQPTAGIVAVPRASERSGVTARPSGPGGSYLYRSYAFGASCQQSYQ